MLKYSGIMCFLKPSFVLKESRAFFNLVSNMCQFIWEKEVISSVSAFKSDDFRPAVFNYSFGGISLWQFCWWR